MPMEVNLIGNGRSSPLPTKAQKTKDIKQPVCNSPQLKIFRLPCQMSLKTNPRIHHVQIPFPASQSDKVRTRVQKFLTTTLYIKVFSFPHPPQHEPHQKFLPLPRALEKLSIINFSVDSACFGSLTRGWGQSLRTVKQWGHMANLSVWHHGIQRASVPSFLCGWKLLKSGPQFTLLRQTVLQLLHGRKPLRRKATLWTSDAQFSRVQIVLGNLAK